MNESGSKTYTPEEIRNLALRCDLEAYGYDDPKNHANQDCAEIEITGMVKGMLLQGATAIERLEKVRKEASAMLKVNTYIHAETGDEYVRKQVETVLTDVLQTANGELGK